MDKNSTEHLQQHFYALKLTKKEQLTKSTFALEFEVPDLLKSNFQFQSGQYVTVKIPTENEMLFQDYSITSAPYESTLSLGIKVKSAKSAAQILVQNFEVGDTLQISEPTGRFTLKSKPNEHRTILGFAAGIGITPILSHLKNILHQEPRTRFFLFFSLKNPLEIIYKETLEQLQKMYGNRFQIFYFFSQEGAENPLFEGRLSEKKLQLIINQILIYEEDDAETTIWDSTDEVLICGPGEMIKTVANACNKFGIPRKNIHFELFDTFDGDIFTSEKKIPLLENIETTIQLSGKNYDFVFKNNQEKILTQLLALGLEVPYSCKSGVCGNCICTLKEGKVELLENEYLTPKEEKEGKILACQSIILSKKINLNFDDV